MQGIERGGTELNQLEYFEKQEISKANSLMNEILTEAKINVQESQSENTTKAYESDWRQFQLWCINNDFDSLPSNEETIALYLSYLAMEGYKTSTIHRKMSSIITAHRDKGYGSPVTQTIRRVMAGIRRRYGTEENGKKPILIDDILSMLKHIPENVKGIRDKALLLIGFAGAFRRSELVSLDVTDVRIDPKGLIVKIKKSKTDQFGQGQSLGIPFGKNKDTCPVEAYRTWLEVSNIKEGPIFRPINRHGHIQPKRLSDKAVSLIVKEYANAIGFEKSEYSGHSLRAGLATTAAMAGKDERTIMQQTRHKSAEMVRKYIRMSDMFVDNAADDIGL